MPSIGNRIRDRRVELCFSQQELADAVGVHQTTVTYWESDKTAPKDRALAKVAEFLKTTPEWLRYGIEERPKREHDRVPVVGYVGAGEEVHLIDDYSSSVGVEEIEAPPGTHDGFAVKVRGKSMSPRYQEGEYLFYSRERGLDPEAILDRDCVVKVLNGPILVKRVLPGYKEGHFTLVSYNAAVKPMQNVLIEWAAPVIWMRPILHGESD